MTTTLKKETLETYYESLLTEYASGCLDEAMSLLVATHASMSERARQHIQIVEDVCGTLIETQETDQISMSRTCLDQTLELLEMRARPLRCDIEPSSKTTSFHIKELESCAIPSVLEAYLSRSKRPLKWHRAAPGIAFIDILMTSNCNSTLQLIKIDPSKPTPRHSHDDIEATLVLNGAFEDETGLYMAGDMVVVDKTIEHTPVAHPQMGCICIAATTAPLRFTGPLGPVLNLFSKF